MPSFFLHPGAEAPGYFQKSLRDRFEADSGAKTLRTRATAYDSSFQNERGMDPDT
jgi:hypothetical protein